MLESDYMLYPLGFLQSPLKQRGEAPNQGLCWLLRLSVRLRA